MTIRKTLVICLVAAVFIFLTGFGGTLLVWYVQHRQPAVTSQTSQKRADTLYSEFVRLERCYEEISEQELDNYTRCKPRKIRFNLADFTELLQLARRGLQIEAAAPFKEIGRIQHYLRVIAELDRPPETTTMQTEKSQCIA